MKAKLAELKQTTYQLVNLINYPDLILNYFFLLDIHPKKSVNEARMKMEQDNKK